MSGNVPDDAGAESVEELSVEERGRRYRVRVRALVVGIRHRETLLGWPCGAVGAGSGVGRNHGSERPGLVALMPKR